MKIQAKKKPEKKHLSSSSSDESDKASKKKVHRIVDSSSSSSSENNEEGKGSTPRKRPVTWTFDEPVKKRAATTAEQELQVIFKLHMNFLRCKSEGS